MVSTRRLRQGIALTLAFAMVGFFIGSVLAAHKPQHDPKGPGPLTVTVDVMPDTLNLRSNGRTVTVNVSVEGGDKTVSDIDTSTVELEGLSALSVEVDIDGNLTSKYDRADFEDEVSPGTAVTVTVDGEFTGGGTFSETDNIRVMD